MKVEAVPNNGTTNLESEIEAGLSWAQRVDIASAFITIPALRLIKRAMAQARKGGRSLSIRLVFGAYLQFTPPEAIDRALYLQRTYPDMFLVKVARNPKFHWKLYIFAKGSDKQLYIGSANFTDSLRTPGGELSVKISAKASDSISQSLQGEFDKLWVTDEGTLSPDTTWLDHYQKVVGPIRSPQAPKRDSDLLNLLKLPKSRKPVVKPRMISGLISVSEETAQILADQTDWYTGDKDWGSIGYDNRRRRDRDHKAKILVVLDFEDMLRLCRTEATADLVMPDGQNYHLAYSTIRCVKYSEIKEELEQDELTEESMRAGKSPTRKQLRTLCHLMDIDFEDVLEIAQTQM